MSWVKETRSNLTTSAPETHSLLNDFQRFRFKIPSVLFTKREEKLKETASNYFPPLKQVQIKRKKLEPVTNAVKQTAKEINVQKIRKEAENEIKQLKSFQNTENNWKMKNKCIQWTQKEFYDREKEPAIIVQELKTDFFERKKQIEAKQMQVRFSMHPCRNKIEKELDNLIQETIIEITDQANKIKELCIKELKQSNKLNLIDEAKELLTELQEKFNDYQTYFWEFESCATYETINYVQLSNSLGQIECSPLLSDLQQHQIQTQYFQLSDQIQLLVEKFESQQVRQQNPLNFTYLIQMEQFIQVNLSKHSIPVQSTLLKYWTLLQKYIFVSQISTTDSYFTQKQLWGCLSTQVVETLHKVNKAVQSESLQDEINFWVRTWEETEPFDFNNEQIFIQKINECFERDVLNLIQQNTDEKYVYVEGSTVISQTNYTDRGIMELKEFENKQKMNFSKQNETNEDININIAEIISSTLNQEEPVLEQPLKEKVDNNSEKEEDDDDVQYLYTQEESQINGATQIQ
ncbi:Hypothetical_protein [Hexamita inflata]|uniref:Hypothetical_protein n=1 Tax=Hexamita inflata TaxID=28002 RepID=A0AA86NDW1_9EUKA|nr:Hypothetical protein HINF_LOCUS5617 [Hexamita inflata]